MGEYEERVVRFNNLENDRLKNHQTIAVACYEVERPEEDFVIFWERSNWFKIPRVFIGRFERGGMAKRIAAAVGKGAVLEEPARTRFLSRGDLLRDKALYGHGELLRVLQVLGDLGDLEYQRLWFWAGSPPQS